MNNIYKSDYITKAHGLYRIRFSRNGAYNRALIVVKEDRKWLIVEGYECFDKRKLRCILRQHGYIH